MMQPTQTATAIHENGATPTAAHYLAMVEGNVHEPTPTRVSKWAADDLLRAVFPEPKWAVPGLIPIGLGALAGRPKMGKSWLALQLAVAVGSGGYALGRDVPRGRVLYLALEDSPRRIQSRLLQQQATAPLGIDFEFAWESMSGSGTSNLQRRIEQDSPALVVVDTISRALGRADQMDLAVMNVVYGNLQQIAVHSETAVLLVDHLRKSAAGGDGDPIDDMMGSTGKSAVVDFAMGLYRKRGERTATLRITGRDVDEQELAVTFDRQLGCWHYEGGADEVRADTMQGAILDALRNLGGTSTVTKIASFLGKQAPHVSRETGELVNKGKVKRVDKRGKEVLYTLTE